MSGHTPTPWRIGREGRGVVADVPAPGLSGSDDVEYYGGHLICESVTPSNAAFIVRAANAHADLLEALKELTSGGATRLRNAPELLMDAVERARAAIAKAEGL